MQTKIFIEATIVHLHPLKRDSVEEGLRRTMSGRWAECGWPGIVTEPSLIMMVPCETAPNDPVREVIHHAA